MAPSVREVFLAVFRGGEESDGESDAEEDGEGFAPSPLGLSVRIGHGGSDSQRVREFAKISERADEIEKERRAN